MLGYLHFNLQIKISGRILIGKGRNGILAGQNQTCATHMSRIEMDFFFF